MAENKKAAAEATEVKKPEAGHTFEVETKDAKNPEAPAQKKTYKTLLALVVIPGVNDGSPITSLEISHSAEAQAYLLENNCIGSVIEEVL